MRMLLSILVLIVAGMLSVGSALDVQSLTVSEMDDIYGGLNFCCVLVDDNYYGIDNGGQECIDGECVPYPENTNWSAKWVAGDFTADGCKPGGGSESNCEYGTLWCGSDDPNGSYGTWAVWKNATCDGSVDHYDTTGAKSIVTSTGDLCE